MGVYISKPRKLSGKKSIAVFTFWIVFFCYLAKSLWGIALAFLFLIVFS
jgi:hypothetical protein